MAVKVVKIKIRPMDTARGRLGIAAVELAHERKKIIKTCRDGELHGARINAINRSIDRILRLLQPVR